MMSSGLMPHGEHAVAFTFTSTVLNPNRRMKNVSTCPSSSTETAFTGLQPGIETRHFDVTHSSTETMRVSWFFATNPVP